MDIHFKATILIVDSSPEQLVLMEELLQDLYHVKLARNGDDALRIMGQAPRPDLVLLDAGLAGMDAFMLAHELKSDFLAADTPLVFLTAAGRPEDAQRALREGGADVITRPFTPEALLARVALHLQLRLTRAMLTDQHRHFEHLVAARTRESALMQDATILAMASLAEARDPDIGNHIRRTQRYVAALARELRFNAAFTAELTDENIALLFRAAPLHDIGKVAVPDAILLKPGRLTDQEFETMKKHTVYGRDAIGGVEQTLGTSSLFLRYAREIAWSHHEKWDGSGYPQRLAGNAIPLAARLMAVADVYDALVSRRLYRPAFTHETAVELIRQGRAVHFDPDVVDAMLVVEEKFKATAAQFQAPA